MTKARAIFSDDPSVVTWLKKEAPALHGAKPIDLLDTDVGASAVEGQILGWPTVTSSNASPPHWSATRQRNSSECLFWAGRCLWARPLAPSGKTDYLHGFQPFSRDTRNAGPHQPLTQNRAVSVMDNRRARFGDRDAERAACELGVGHRGNANFRR